GGPELVGVAIARDELGGSLLPDLVGSGDYGDSRAGGERRPAIRGGVFAGGYVLGKFAGDVGSKWRYSSGVNRALVLAFAGMTAFAQTLAVPLGLDAFVPVPTATPLTREKVELGKRLFFDKRLSLDSTVACATCHDPKLAYTDSRKTAVGIEGRVGERRSPR